jgi:hypothetical protein
VEGYNRQLRKVTKSKSIFPTAESARKLLFLANRDILKKWTMPIQNWPLILNQLVIRFEGHIQFRRFLFCPNSCPKVSLLLLTHEAHACYTLV